MLRRKALIFGIRGQDGRYLASFLAAKGFIEAQVAVCGIF
jgi:GDP-D-mannose dehydratase